MVAVGRVPVAVVVVVEMVAVRDRLVPAAGPVYVGVPRMGKVRQRMLIVMALMRSVGMSLVHVIDVSLALRARVPAAGPMDVIMLVNGMLGGCHGSSLL
jgi:hypothetical protein